MTQLNKTLPFNAAVNSSNNVITHQDNNERDVQHEKENVSALSINWHMLAIPTLCRLRKAKKKKNRKIIIAFMMESATGVLEGVGARIYWLFEAYTVKYFCYRTSGAKLTRKQREATQCVLFGLGNGNFVHFGSSVFSGKCINLNIRVVDQILKRF